MDEILTVEQLQERLLELAKPLAALDLPLLDSHGATLANDLLVDDQLAIKNGQQIGSTQIALAASLGLDRLPTRPHPRVVIISAGDDLVEPGSDLANDDDEFESNSWFLTTFMREAGAHAFRVHTIPETVILKMLGKTQIHRQTKKVKLSKALDLNSDKGSYVRAKFIAEGQVTPLTNQESLITLSEADSLIALPEKSKKLSAGDLVNVLLINRVSN